MDEIVTGLIATAFAGTDGNAGLPSHAHADTAGAETEMFYKKIPTNLNLATE